MSKSEERAWPRLSTMATITFEREGLREDYQIVDFPAGGMSIRGERPLVANQDISVGLYFGRNEIPTAGKVVWCKGPEDGLFTIGIKIEVTDSDARQVLVRYLTTLL